MGKKVLTTVEKKENPNIEIPLRTLSNVIFDKTTKQLKLGDKVGSRSYFNVAHSKKFMQTLMVASFCKSLLDEKIHASIRDMYYNLKRTLPDSNENTFDEQNESDPLVIDLEVALDTLREELHLTTDRKGIVAGNVIIKDRGDAIDWSKLGSGGWSIPSTVNEISFDKVDAKFVLVVEKNAGFERLHEDKFWQKQNCIIVTSQGQTTRGIRRLLQRLSTEYKLPLYVLADFDPWGFYIYSVLKFGSINLAHMSDTMTLPKAKFLGIMADDITNYGLQKHFIKFKDVDMTRLKQIQEYDWFKDNKPWQKEFKKMRSFKAKVEIQALSSRGITFISDTYLPEKIKKKEFLD